MPGSLYNRTCDNPLLFGSWKSRPELLEDLDRINTNYMDLLHFQAASDAIAKCMPNWACHGLVQPLLPGTDTPYCGVIYIVWLGSD